MGKIAFDPDSKGYMKPGQAYSIAFDVKIESASVMACRWLKLPEMQEAINEDTLFLY